MEMRKTASDTVERSLEEALRWWLAHFAPEGGPLDRAEVIRRLNRDIAHSDALLSGLVNAILHHPRLQKLEASWRGLHYLVGQLDEGTSIKIRVLNASWSELARDLDRALEFDQSQLFRKGCSEEFDMPGGEPFGLLLGDYQIAPRPSADHPTDDVRVLGAVAQIAAAAFAPFIVAAQASFLGLDSFTDLELPMNLAAAFDQAEYMKWNNLRQSEDARFLGVVVPQVLMRRPYRDDGARVDGFRFHEDVQGPDRHNYLWGNAAYPFAAVVVRALRYHGWPADLRGLPPAGAGPAGGQVVDLPLHTFGTDGVPLAPRCSTDAFITELQEKELSDLGFMPLCACPGTAYSIFYTNQSIQKPRKYDLAAATINARMSAMLQYMLCASRFAHYVKVMMRDKVGLVTDTETIEDTLNAWLAGYCSPSDDIGPELEARHPLRHARVEVRDHPDKPGTYRCVMHLQPRFQLDQMAAGVRLATELGRPGTSNQR